MILFRFKQFTLTGALLVFSGNLSAQLPVVENVHFEQRTDGSLLVDVYYDVTGPGGLPLEITMLASEDNGTTWNLQCSSTTGDVGVGINAGSDRHIVWDFHADNPGVSGSDYRVRILAKSMLCGQTITEDYTFTEDLICFGKMSPILSIGASNITVDLGGHKILGDYSTGSFECILLDNTEGVRIRNGSIEGFIGGIVFGNADSTVITDMSFSNFDVLDPDIFVVGINFGRSKGVEIRNCRFEYPLIAHKNGIHNANGDVLVDSIEMIGGGVGIDIGGNVGQGATYTTLTNSTFHKVTIAGILFQKCENALIRDNVFTENGASIMVDAAFPGILSNVVIEDNLMDKGYIGISSLGGTNMTIRNNYIKDHGRYGIQLAHNMGCPESNLETCFCSTSNTIENNILRNNYIDLYHHEECLGNSWINNDCETSSGSEIPECTPQVATAGEFFDLVDSAAQEVATDAALIMVQSPVCDSLGDAYKWLYIYESETTGEQFEFWYKNGELIRQDSVTIPWDVPEDPIPITKQWIDSDSAMLLANQQGGSAFMQSNEMITIDMRVVQEAGGWLLWILTYWAEGSNLNLTIDAEIQ